MFPIHRGWVKIYKVRTGRSIRYIQLNWLLLLSYQSLFQLPVIQLSFDEGYRDE